MRTRFAALALPYLIAGSTLAEAQGIVFTNDSLTAFAFTSDLFVNVFANRSQSPSGTFSTATLNISNFVTGDFVECTNTNFTIKVTPAGATLAFVTEGGFNCPVGQQVIVSCDVTVDSSISQNVTNGTVTAGFNEGHFTTHGVSNSYADLSCQLSAFGTQVTSDGGSAFSGMQSTTPSH